MPSVGHKWERETWVGVSVQDKTPEHGEWKSMGSGRAWKTALGHLGIEGVVHLLPLLQGNHDAFSGVTFWGIRRIRPHNTHSIPLRCMRRHLRVREGQQLTPGGPVVKGGGHNPGPLESPAPSMATSGPAGLPLGKGTSHGDHGDEPKKTEFWL